MKLYHLNKLLAVSLCAFAITACDDEVFDKIDAEIDAFDVSPNDVFIGDRLRIRWESTGAFEFDARIYLSEDRNISSSDTIIVDERCDWDDDRHCRVGEEIQFDCYYRQDLDLDCEEDGDLMDITNIGGFLDVIPKNGYLILELCNDNDECESRSESITFN